MDEERRIAILTGAGISAESGIRTFRGADGLWEDHRIEDVASPDGWNRDKSLVLRFYDERRTQVRRALPNAAHLALVELEREFRTDIITQNIDDLHEKAGSAHILHLHGEILKARSSGDETHVVPLEQDTIPLGWTCPKGFQMRPHIVWFGEAVPMLEQAAGIVAMADIVIIVGTSMNVYPAAGLVHYARPDATLIAVDPDDIPLPSGVVHVKEKAGKGVPLVVGELLAKE